MSEIKSIMFTGDSITDYGRARPYAEGFGALGTGFVTRLFVDAWARHPNSGVRFLNSAVSGDTSAQLLCRFDTDVIKHKPDVLFIMIGVNDAWRHYDGSQYSIKLLSVSDSAENLETMIKLCRENGITPVILSPYFLELNREDPMRKWVDALNVEFRALAKKYKLEYIDIQAEMDEYVRVKGGVSYIISADRVHPSDVGIAKIADCIEANAFYRSIFGE